uniref:Putative methyltransferase n=1 Tax=viral metagenome TaxID=1070528 RepID=A0A6H1ZAP3_9ZZZZ
MRDFINFDRYLDELLIDVYPQPPDKGHTRMAREVIYRWIPDLIGCKSVLDIGCGEAFLQPEFERIGISYTGVTLGKDYENALAQGRNVYRQDFSFLDFPDNSFDLVFSRHSLEHSPFPLLSLMEWHRVTKFWLCLILPTPGYWLYGGRGHYSVMPDEQATFLLERAGWNVIWTDFSDEREFRYMAEKRKRRKEKCG